MSASPDVRIRDSDLVQESLTRPEAFAELFDQYAGMLYRYVSKRIGPDTAEDIVGETFLIAFSRRSRYDQTYGDARPWLFGITTKLISRHYRAEAARYRALLRSPVEPFMENPAERVVAEVAAQAVRPALAGALAALPRRDRDVLLLIAWGDLTYEETARSLGIPVGTVRSRLNRARRTLRKALGDDHPLREET
ncbi:RNA polymerase sigma factor [Sinosporangium album]|nr:RNA polymerase sigma factor [Sinosporangium album]